MQIKRYPEYKASGIDWLGEIPHHWKLSKLRYYVNISNGCDPKSEGDTPVYGSGGKSFKSCGEFKEGPTVLLGRKGTISSPRWVAGKYWNVDTAFDTQMLNQFNIRFFYYMATIFDYDKYQTNTAVPSMTQSDYGNFILPIPTISEQQAIAAYLDEKTAKIDALIAEKKKQVNDLQAYRASVITEAVTRGLNPNAPLRPSGIDWLGEIPEHWMTVKLGFLADVQTGSTPSTSTEKYWDNPQENWFTPGDFDGFTLNDSKRKVSSIAFTETVCRVFPRYTVLMVGIGATLGKVAYTKKECSANQQINAIIFKDSINPIFGAYYLFAISDIIKAHSNAATLPILNQEQTKKLYVLVPPIAEQQEIASYLDEKTSKIDELINELNLQIDELAEYKQAVISEAVTGKVDVRDYKSKR